MPLRFQSPMMQVFLPILAGACGAVLYIVSPLSHQAFCAPLPIIVAPEGASVVPAGE